MIELSLVSMGTLFIVCFFKVIFALGKEKKSKIIYVGLMLFLYGLLMLVSLMLISQQKDYEKQIKERASTIRENKW